jgi:hypothetical protein
MDIDAKILKNMGKANPAICKKDNACEEVCLFQKYKIR